MKLARNGCALLLVDLQRAFCHDRGSMAEHGRDIGRLRRAVYVSHRLAGAARKAGVPVAWTRMVFRPDYADGGLLVGELRPDLARIRALRAGTPDAELAPGADRDEDEPVFDRTRFSALLGTHLEDWLRAAAVDTVVVGGVTTSLAVRARSATSGSATSRCSSCARPAAISRTPRTRPRSRRWIPASPA